MCAASDQAAQANPEELVSKPIFLERHSQAPSSVGRLWAKLGRTGALLRIAFRIPGDTSGLLFPPRQPSEFRSNLWEHTCLEAFIRPEGLEEYAEINLSPSRQWAAYHFDSYRSGMRRADIDVRNVVSTPWKNRFELSAAIAMPDEWGRLAWHLNLAAVLEEKDGAKSYWALKHPPGAPDFHHPDCFVLELPA
jgi:hypothetical protein